MTNPISGKKRTFGRLTIPFIVGLLLALPLTACDRSGEPSSGTKVVDAIMIDPALTDAASPAAGNKSGEGDCDAQMEYGKAWANRMPPEFPIYPKSRVDEAAGADAGMCDIRVVSFTTSRPLQDVINYYYTRARKSGFEAEYQIRAGEHILGGTRMSDGGAYVITFNAAQEKGILVNIIANNGR